MASFGEGLKREREKKKITLEQVSASTKISVRMLRALEENKFDQLPGGIFNKGFVRAYARHLGLDEEQTVADYLSAAHPSEAPLPEDLELRAMAEQKEKERQRQASLTRDFPWGWVAVALLLIAVGFSLWGVRYGRTTQAGKAESGETVVKHEDAGMKPLVTPPEIQPPLATGPDAGAAGKEATPHLSPAVASEEARLASGAGLDSGFTVLVTAQDNSWLSITADGKTIFTGTLIAPGEQLVRAHDSIVIRAGNTAGLDFDFNGKRLPPQGDEAEAKTLTFRASGLVSSQTANP